MKKSLLVVGNPGEVWDVCVEVDEDGDWDVDEDAAEHILAKYGAIGFSIFG